MRYVDPDGCFLEVTDNGDGTYVISGGVVNSEKNIYVVDENGNKIFGSARDVGNYAAGYVAGKSGLYWIEARLGFDAYQSFKSRRFCSEGAATQAAQRLGFTAGQNSSQGKAVTNYRLMRMQMMQYR